MISTRPRRLIFGFPAEAPAYDMICRGVSDHLPPGGQPHWLPYVAVDDADVVAARAWDAGGTVLMAPETVPGAGRLAIIADPTFVYGDAQ
jgi:predicted enzyme related to lactoylglutathione lyase